MQKLLLVLKFELISSLKRRSYQLTTFGFPLITILFFSLGGLLRAVSSRLDDSRRQDVKLIHVHQIVNNTEGYIDYSGVIKVIPESIPDYRFVKFSDQSRAEKALESGQIRAYFLIPEKFIQTGEIVYVRPELNPIDAQNQARLIQQVLTFNLLGGDDGLANLYLSPLDPEVVLLEEQIIKEKDDPLAFFMPFATTLFFYITILMSASLLLSSVSKDKENRMLEILISSLPSWKILSGKILGLGLAGLMQISCWMGTAYLLIHLSNTSLQIPFTIHLPPFFFGWGLLFFILGYVLYACLMASIGALATKLREASQLAFILLLPMMIPLLTITVTMDEPNGTWSTALSLIPLTAPVSMLTRLATVEVPQWQIILAILLMIISILVVLVLVARLFRAQILLVGEPFNIKRLSEVLSGR